MGHDKKQSRSTLCNTHKVSLMLNFIRILHFDLVWAIEYFQKQPTLTNLNTVTIPAGTRRCLMSIQVANSLVKSEHMYWLLILGTWRPLLSSPIYLNPWLSKVKYRNSPGSMERTPGLPPPKPGYIKTSSYLISFWLPEFHPLGCPVCQLQQARWRHQQSLAHNVLVWIKFPMKWKTWFETTQKLHWFPTF